MYSIVEIPAQPATRVDLSALMRGAGSAAVWCGEEEDELGKALASRPKTQAQTRQ